MSWAKFIRTLWLVLCTMGCGGSGFAFLLQASSADARPLSFDRYDDSIRSAVKRYWSDFPDWKYWHAQLFQESQFDPMASSVVGAEGLAQFLPGTWADVTHQLGWSGVSATQADPAIQAGAYYMSSLRHQWAANRPTIEKHFLAEAAYNAGMGNILAAQKRCGGAALWMDISPCLAQITGPLAKQTLDYVSRISEWRKELGK